MQYFGANQAPSHLNNCQSGSASFPRPEEMPSRAGRRSKSVCRGAVWTTPSAYEHTRQPGVRPHPDYARRPTRQVPDYCAYVSIVIILWHETGVDHAFHVGRHRYQVGEHQFGHKVMALDEIRRPLSTAPRPGRGGGAPRTPAQVSRCRAGGLFNCLAQFDQVVVSVQDHDALRPKHSTHLGDGDGGWAAAQHVHG